MNRLGNLALALVSGLVLAFVALEAFSFWKNLSYQPAHNEEALERSTNYPGLAPREIGGFVFKSQGCIACHNLDLAGGVLAPSLDNIGVRRDAAWLREKLRDPHASVPGTFMPSFSRLSHEEIEGLVAYLGTLTSGRSGPDNAGTATMEIPKDEQGQPRFTMADVERGKELFRAQGCMGCHSINGITEGGQIGPNLTHEALRLRTDEWQLRHLINPVSVYVLGEAEGISWIMPSYRQLSEEDLKALVAFLQSLK